MANIPYEYRAWPCPNPQMCPAKDASGHSPTYCPFGRVMDTRPILGHDNLDTLSREAG